MAFGLVPEARGKVCKVDEASDNLVMVVPRESPPKRLSAPQRYL